jgi:hypothetical protein
LRGTQPATVAKDDCTTTKGNARGTVCLKHSQILRMHVQGTGKAPQTLAKTQFQTDFKAENVKIALEPNHLRAFSMSA